MTAAPVLKVAAMNGGNRMFRYTDERNAQIVVALLKKKGIRYVVASPGTTNGPIVGSVQNDPFFTVVSCVDERSAAYMACGIAESTGEAAVLSCTGATASRDYMPGLTEAFYRKLPVLAITSMGRTQEIGNLRTQIIDRSVLPNDIANESVNIEPVFSDDDARFAELQANRAMEALFLNGGGPAHIQLVTLHIGTLGTAELPPVNDMRVLPLSAEGSWPDIPEGAKVLVYLGAHRPFTARESAALERFSDAHDAPILINIASGYRGRAALNASLVGPQMNDNPEMAILEPDLVIHIGEMSGNYDSLLFMNRLSCSVWRVSLDGRLRQPFGHLRYVFQSPVDRFLEHYSEGFGSASYRDAWRGYVNELQSKVPELPFSDIWIARRLSHDLPEGAIFHPSIMSSLSAANFFQPEGGVETAANVGGFGIDGCVSSLVGASIVNPGRLCISLVGDLAFFYDMNCLGNRHVGPNLRIVLVNNNRGMTFKHTDHFGSVWAEEANKYLAAAGHFLPKGDAVASGVTPAQAWSESLGFKYLRADSEEPFDAAMETLLDPSSESPVLLECLTKEADERRARDLLFELDTRKTAKGRVKEAARAVLPKGALGAAKKVLGR